MLSSVQLFLTAWAAAHVDSSVHGIFQWVAISYSRGSSQPRDQTLLSLLHWQVEPLSHLRSPLSSNIPFPPPSSPWHRHSTFPIAFRLKNHILAWNMPSSLSSSSCFVLTSQPACCSWTCQARSCLCTCRFFCIAASPIVTYVFGGYVPYHVPATFKIAFVRIILHGYMVEASQLAEWVFVKLSSFSLSTSPAL